MPILAGQAHPSGPERGSFTERTIRIQAETKNCVLTLAYPKPDEIVDWVKDGTFSASDPFPYPLTLRFEYVGHFWQGVFGSVGLDVQVNTRKQESVPWKDLNSLLEGIRLQQVAHNQVTKNNRPESRQEWLDPFLSQLNGIPCIQQYVAWGNDPKGECIYYFPFEDDHALELKIRMVDNSNRPGFWGGNSKLTPSDWRPRAEDFAKRLLATVKVRVEARALPK